MYLLAHDLTHFEDNILKDPKLIFCTQLNDFKYCHVRLTIQFNISYLFSQC